ncbi:MAG TPA: LysR family transcriptional regulator [Polyangia bacterium]|nr:LysR family transcriptional regulator [Polyangia bacterium]
MQVARLEGFYWVARTGGYAAAARAFPYPLSQPAVFQQVRKLEDELGVRLFERVGKAEVRLTAAGRQLYEHVGPFFERLPAVERALKGATPARELCLAAEPLILQQVLPGWIRQLQRQEPELRVDVRELAAPDPEVVRGGEVDLAVAYFPGALPAGLASRQVATLSAFLVLPAGSALAQRPKVGLRELASRTLVTYNPGTIHHELQRLALARSGAAPARVVSASTTEAILGLVGAGIGWSLVPSIEESLLRRRGVVVRRFAPGRGRFPVRAVWRASGPVNPAVDVALDALGNARR